MCGKKERADYILCNQVTKDESKPYVLITADDEKDTAERRKERMTGKKVFFQRETEKTARPRSR